MTLPDAGARQQALDPLLSFCISAPAGSGKTGLLVQRFLCLLSRVAEPERVVAITFTRKAAAEMRARVLAALRLEAEDIAPQSDHEQRSRELARAVLEVDRRASWDLLANPSRLRIQTIDSFCGELARQMPVLSGFGGPLAASDNATALYREAIERFLQRELGASAGATKGAGTDSDLSNLLLHLDNQWEVAVDLLTRLLQRREQWQPVLGSSGLDDGERSGLQAVTASLVAFRIEQLGNLLAPEMLELGELMDFSRENHPSGSVGTAPNDALEDWRGVAGLLLTSTGVWRKSVNKRDGFPAGSGRAAQMKNAAKSLLSRLTERNDPALLQALRQLLTLPDPAGEPEHWNVLASLTRLLPRLGAELLLVFQQAGEVDHAQVAMAANAALGSDEAPTDIALRLDHNVEHLLVDEFQDTSSGQFELIRRLTRGWAEQNAENPEAPRTLLLVGDPMQSIYGFRDANVGLFIKARDEGLGELPLEALDLSVNFRSQSSLVDWVNAHFQGAFPPLDDAQLAAVAYRASSWAREGPVAPELRLFSGDGAEQAEADALCDSLEEGLSDDKVTSIAVLGRSRSQLRPVLEVMRERGIPYAARDLETLQHRPLIRDLVSLCAVLSDHFDRFAWLSLLRSPGIALDNEDLLHMALQAPLAIDVLAEERVLPILEGLSPAGRERVAHLLSLLRWAEHYRDRLAVRVWVEECWLRLGGAAPLADIGDRDDAEQFFQCLEQLAAGQHRLTARRLQEAVAALFAAPGDELAKVQVMTLHKAKGLEFDWVFIPALGKTTVHRDSELLLWDEFALPGQAPSFLLDIRGSASARAAPRLYDYLKEQARQKGKMEATRLFYVG
ncbi:MAG: ATP-dependent helicase/nuclease subunit A, partial [Halieaceae bacterium]